MVIKNVEFIKSAADISGFILSTVPQIAICGKSNVGKSSFINFITNNSKLARTSNTPGRTRLVNYFKVNDFILVDLPGYGYAKGSKSEIAGWQKLMETFIHNSQNLKHFILLVDIRHLPTKDDLQLVNYLNYYRLPFSVIATKADKLSKAQIKPNLMNISSELKIGIDNIFAVSSTNKSGKDEVLALLDKVINVKAE